MESEAKEDFSGRAPAQMNKSKSEKNKTPKQLKKTKCPATMDEPPSVVLELLPEVRFPRPEPETHLIAKPLKKDKACLFIPENAAASGSESMPEVGNQSAPAKSPKKLTKTTLSGVAREDPAVSGAESLPEVGVASKGTSRKRRVVPSRYKESAKNRAAATPTKRLEASGISINESRLFSTATASTPNSTIGKKEGTVIKSQPKQPPKMANLPLSDKTAPKIKKSNKTATVKVKPMRAIDATKAQTVGDADRVPEHQLLYNQYLQWTYLCRVTEASIKRELPQLNFQARQLSALVEGAREEKLELERKLQAVTLYREMARLEHELTAVLGAINGSADAVRGDLSRLTTILDATRNRLQLKHFTEPTDVARYAEDLLQAAERCRDAVSALSDVTAPHSSLLKHTAESVSSLQQALRGGMDDTQRSAELLRELNSLTLQEASLAVGSSGQ
ncbi:uncharacterized protein LOC119092949 [Pollicipes pollicipes]|uniref:uncharacterized protein LOC119092949 n=1 Tax=Pollicipes pollicipes TaxID=41117 RepID=UPI001884CED1|nr:uncharacterized protein LOC119092949 [Pollicipes pollicipes]